MASHVQTDPVLAVPYVSLAGPQIKHFSSLDALEAALIADTGQKAENLQSMTVNDKLYAARVFLEGGGVFA